MKNDKSEMRMLIICCAGTLLWLAVAVYWQGYNNGYQDGTVNVPPCEPCIEAPVPVVAPITPKPPETAVRVKEVPKKPISQAVYPETMEPTNEELKQMYTRVTEEVKEMRTQLFNSERINDQTASQIRNGLQDAETTNEMYRDIAAMKRIIKKELGYTIDQYGGFKKE